MQRTILVVEEPEIAEPVENLLIGAGHRVVVANDGAEGLRLMSVEKPWLVVTGRVLPDMTGYEMLGAAFLRELLPKPRTIMFLERTYPADIGGGVRVSVDMYLKKPFHPQEFLSFVNILTNYKG